MRYQRAEHPLKLDGLDAARSFFAGCLADSDASREWLWVAHVDEEARCLHVSRHPGDAHGADMPVRQIVVDAATLGSAGIVLAHNHPSGDSRPSESDRRATRKLATAAEAIDCALLDHLVFGGGGDCSSFRRMGLL
jgi:DNA repair protein RadC